VRRLYVEEIRLSCDPGWTFEIIEILYDVDVAVCALKQREPVAPVRAPAGSRDEFLLQFP